MAFGPHGTLTDPERLHLSAGNLPLPDKLTAARSVSHPSMPEMTWQDDPGSGLAWSDDDLMIMAGYGEEFKGPFETGVLRKQEWALIVLPAAPAMTDSVWLFFASAGRNFYSPDQYFGI